MKFIRTFVSNIKFFIQRMEEINKLSIEEKRKLYHCGKNFVTLKDIPSWESLDTLASLKNLNDAPSIVGSSSYNCNPEINKLISLFDGNIVSLEIDAVVNAADNLLLGGGGVDGAIHEAAGSYLLEECRSLAGCNTGDAKITFGYDLPARYVIHTVGPVGENEHLLQSCYSKCLSIAAAKNLKTVSFPCISTGVFGYPKDKAANVALKTVRSFLENNENNFERIIFCLHNEVDKNLYFKLLTVYYPKK